MAFRASVSVGIAAGLLATFMVAPAPAHAGPSSAVIKNSSSSNTVLGVCRDWGVSSCSSGFGLLNPGENSKSKYGWGDADGIIVYSGSYEPATGRCGYYQRKIAGCWDCTKTFTVYRRNCD